MNLRDQFLKAGLVNKNQADAALREKRKQEKIAEGHAASKRAIEEKEAAERAREAAQREAELLARRRASREREEAELRVMRCRQILRAHQLRFRAGPQRFYHWSPDRTQVWRMWLPERIAGDLRLGRLAIAWVDDHHPEAVVIDRATAERIAAIRPELLLFRNEGPSDPDPAEQLYEG